MWPSSASHEAQVKCSGCHCLFRALITFPKMTLLQAAHVPLAAVLTPCLFDMSSSSDPSMEFKLSSADLALGCAPFEAFADPSSCTDKEEGSNFDKFAIRSSSSFVAEDAVIADATGILLVGSFDGLPLLLTWSSN